MQVNINGKQHDITQTQPLKNIIDELCVHPDRVVAEVNGSIIKKDRWLDTQISENDTIELVSFVGGG